MSERPASAPQLWRLNVAGRLALVDGPVSPIAAAEAKEVITDVMAARDAFEVVTVDDPATQPGRPA
jgi:hypothetical protein